MIQKLSAPQNCAIMLRASMYTYGAITHCVFCVHSIFSPTSEQQTLGEASTKNLEPNNPKKRGAKAACTAKSATNDDTIEEDGPVTPLKNNQKKE
ncbi:hypothetical protein RHSIM_Rhsim13G0068800 [Rhododendron simsii]|uniref:Uncharacterized protein n=1 Tax=Rhododendron simsii TaxID=118357 RepID=A0A834L7P4_RHOSS|nr:hypothetical protein RHSIM_Rhsim13G0068800 [Rhododendron simsii]